MSITDVSINLWQLGGLLVAVATIVAMFVTLRERLRDHDERLRYHARLIDELKISESDNKSLFAQILERIENLTKMIEEMRTDRRGMS